MMGLPLEGKYYERVPGIAGEAIEKLILKNRRDRIISAAQDKPRIYLIEDNAQAPLGMENGRATGTIGHIGIASLNFHKHIGRQQ